jgi:hypothetical protein
MQLDGSGYGRAWVCERFAAIKHSCKGRIELADDESLTDLQLAEEIARGVWGNAKESANLQAKYRRLATPLRDLAKSKLLSPAERRVVSEAAVIASRLANAAKLAKNDAQRKEKTDEAERKRRYREAKALLGPPFAATPDNLEAVVIDVIAIDRFTQAGEFEDVETIDQFNAELRNMHEGKDDRLGSLMHNIAARHNFQREDLADSWAQRDKPIADLHTQLAEALPALRQAIQADPPVYLQGVRRVLAEAEAEKVVRLR